MVEINFYLNDVLKSTSIHPGTIFVQNIYDACSVNDYLVARMSPNKMQGVRNTCSTS